MKNFIKMISVSSIILFTAGCGSDVNSERENLDSYISPAPEAKKSDSKVSEEKDSKDKEPNPKDDDQNKTVDCSDFLKKNKDKTEILDSSLECPPYVDLYHPEYDATTEVKPYFKYQYDEEKKAKVIYFKSNGVKNAIHILGYDAKNRYEWNEYPEYQNKFNISWDAKFSNDFIIFVVIKFQDKNETIQKDLVYTTLKNDTDDVNLSQFLTIKLDDSYKDGQWKHYERNIMDDVHTFYPDAKIVYKENYYGKDQNDVNGFALRGTGSITDIMLTK